MSYLKQLSALPRKALTNFLHSLSVKELQALDEHFHFTAHPHQLPPEGDWTSWLILGGRGSGKTRAGAEAVLEKVLNEEAFHIALVGETINDASEVMVEGVSGILACASEDTRPQFRRSERRLVFPTGATATIFSAKDPDSLRGPQFDFAWCDELAKWTKAREAWDMLQFGLRLGKRPQQIVTTTPRPMKLLRDLINDPNTVVTRASTYINKDYLAPAFFSAVVNKYEGARLGAQELEGKLFDDHPGALWTRGLLDTCRLTKKPDDLARIVVAVDPPVSTAEGADECGIIVAGVSAAQAGAEDTRRAYILADYSAGGLSPRQWAERAVRAYRDFNADRLIAETNQGGDMVRTVIAGVDPRVAFKSVFARRGKITRAEPVAALYERGLVYHIGAFEKLEDQMCAFTLDGLFGSNSRSPDRVDALVWAVTELCLSAPGAEPRVRLL